MTFETPVFLEPNGLIAIDTPIPTPDGWKTLGTLCVGDLVYDEKGQPCDVLTKTDVVNDRPCYRITFDDKSEIITDAKQQWMTLTVSDREKLLKFTDEYREKRRKARPSRSNGTRPHVIEMNKNRVWVTSSPPQPTAKTTQEILSTITVRSNRVNHSILIRMPLDHPDSDLLIDPYVLGVWLGDGTSSSSELTEGDEEIIQELGRRGYPCKKWKDKYAYGIGGELGHKLRVLGLKGNKHIPREYFRASFNQRLELLQGLMDTDGTCDKTQGKAIFCSCRPELANDTLELIRTLGIKASMTKRDAKIYGRKTSDRYTITFVSNHPVFRLPRKLILQRRERKRHSPAMNYYIVTVEETAPVSLCGIAVSSESGAYLLGKAMITTHDNTPAILEPLDASNPQMAST